MFKPATTRQFQYSRDNVDVFLVWPLSAAVYRGVGFQKNPVHESYSRQLQLIARLLAVSLGRNAWICRSVEYGPRLGVGSIRLL
jgi:hypothetical protein